MQNKSFFGILNTRATFMVI